MVWTTVTGRRIAMARHKDFRFQFCNPADSGIEIVNLKPEQHSVAIRPVIRITNMPMMMLNFESVKLED
jgi:hypothetical protein